MQLLLNSYSYISVFVSSSYFTVHVLSMILMTGSFEITRNGSFDFLAAGGGKLFHWELSVESNVKHSIIFLYFFMQ
jgi:hypothetical protein